MQTNSAQERDPSGISSDTPGAKLDAGKVRVGLMLMGFLPAFEYVLNFVSTRPIRTGSEATLRRAAEQWPRALFEVAKVTTAGAEKYTPNGWATVPNGVERYLDAYGRHLLQMQVSKCDDGPGGTGCRHDAQCVWNLLATTTLALKNKVPADAPKAPYHTYAEMAESALDELERTLQAEEAGT